MLLLSHVVLLGVVTKFSFATKLDFSEFLHISNAFAEENSFQDKICIHDPRSVADNDILRLINWKASPDNLSGKDLVAIYDESRLHLMNEMTSLSFITLEAYQSRITDFLRLDSKIYLISLNNEIKEIYSLSSFGGPKIVIGTLATWTKTNESVIISYVGKGKHIWDRRNNFHGVEFTSTLLPYQYTLKTINLIATNLQ